MDWDSFWKALAAVDWVAVSQVIATVVLVLTLIFTERRARKDARRADAAAERAENAARGTIDALTRIGKSIEDIELSGGGSDSHTRPSVEWRLTHYRGDTYQLENVGSAKAEGVDLTSHESLMLMRNTLQGGPDLGPGEAMTFMAAKTMGTRDSTITVTWTDAATGEEGRWRYPLPARPPR